MGQLISYFLYIAWHWNLPLAFFMIRHEIKGEKKYALRTSGIRKLPKKMDGEPQMLGHASINQPANYYILEKLFDSLSAEVKQTRFVDIGCGMGRVLAVAACKGFIKLSGIDIVQEFVDQASRMLNPMNVAGVPKLTSVCRKQANLRYQPIPGLFFFSIHSTKPSWSLWPFAPRSI
jgi:SAM-dependent methyltransferase